MSCRFTTWRATAIGLLFGTLFAYFVLVPAQSLLGFNFVAGLPRFRQFRVYEGLSVFVLVGASVVLFPFFVALGYGLGRRAVEWAMRIVPPLRPFLARADASASATQGSETVRRRTFLGRRFRRFFTPSSKFVRMFVRGGRYIKYFYIGACWIFISLELILAAVFAGRTAVHLDEARVVFSECSRCHSVFSSFNYVLTPNIWAGTIDRMAQNAADRGAACVFSPEKRKKMLSYLVAVRGKTGWPLFAEKCFACHLPPSVFEKARTIDEWALLIDREHRQNSFSIQQRDSEELVRFIEKHPKWIAPVPQQGSPVAVALERKLLFENKCGLCHTLDIIKRPYIKAASWPTILARMGTKAPSVLSVDASLSLLSDIRRLIGNPTDFSSQFPHSGWNGRR